jgi:hypothetical protein
MGQEMEVREILEDAARRGIAYLEGIGERGVAPSPRAVAAGQERERCR